MGKISVGSLAKTLGIEPKEAIARLKEIGVDAKTATSQVDEDVVERLSAPQPKENGTEEVRVASNIIRRRAKVVPVAEAPVVAEAPEKIPPEPVESLPAAMPAEEPRAVVAVQKPETVEGAGSDAAPVIPEERAEPADVKPGRTRPEFLA